MTPSRVGEACCGRNGRLARRSERGLERIEQTHRCLQRISAHVARVWFAGNVSYVFPSTVSAPILRCPTIPLNSDFVIYQLKANLLRGCFCAAGSSGVR